MHTVTIPGTSLSVSSLCLGSTEFGAGLSREDTFRLLDRYAELGGNFIDTARVYADWVPGIERSISEKTIGAWLRQRRNRSSIVLATKGAHPDLKETPRQPRVSRQDILFDLQESLRNLMIDRIDLYWLHRDDPVVPVGELLETLEEQVRAGRIRYYAASNWTPVRLRMARVYAQEHGLKGFVADQILWNLGVPSKLPYGDPTCGFMDEERFVFHEETGMAVVPYQSQAFGMFHRMLNKTLDKLKADIRDMYRMPETIIRFNRAQQIMDKTGFTMTQVVLGFLLSQPFSTIPIMGCKTVEQLNDSMGAADVNIDNELIIYLIHGK